MYLKNFSEWVKAFLDLFILQSLVIVIGHIFPLYELHSVDVLSAIAKYVLGMAQGDV